MVRPVVRKWLTEHFNRVPWLTLTKRASKVIEPQRGTPPNQERRAPVPAAQVRFDHGACGPPFGTPRMGPSESGLRPIVGIARDDKSGVVLAREGAVSAERHLRASLMYSAIRCWEPISLRTSGVPRRALCV
jgi:hypothetical protein